MTEEACIPDEATRKRLLANLRKTRLDLQEFGFQLEELLAQIEKDIRQQKMKRFEEVRSLIR